MVSDRAVTPPPIVRRLLAGQAIDLSEELDRYDIATYAAAVFTRRGTHTPRMHTIHSRLGRGRDGTYIRPDVVRYGRDITAATKVVEVFAYPRTGVFRETLLVTSEGLFLVEVAQFPEARRGSELAFGTADLADICHVDSAQGWLLDRLAEDLGLLYAIIQAFEQAKGAQGGRLATARDEVIGDHTDLWLLGRAVCPPGYMGGPPPYVPQPMGAMPVPDWNSQCYRLLFAHADDLNYVRHTAILALPKSPGGDWWTLPTPHMICTPHLSVALILMSVAGLHGRQFVTDPNIPA